MYVIPIHYKAVSGMCEKDLAHPVAIVLALFQALMCGQRKKSLVHTVYPRYSIKLENLTLQKIGG